MMNFVKNYLLLVLMAIGFLTIFVMIAILGQSAKTVAQTPAGQTTQTTDASAQNTPPTQAVSVLTIQKKDGQIVQFNVELAKTEEEQEHGLMDRTTMAEDHGMLFVFQDESDKAFWMKNTLIPLDMVYIRKDGTVSHIHPDAVPQDLTPIPSNGPVMFVLEIGGGVAKKLGIEVGDKVIHPEIHI